MPDRRVLAAFVAVLVALAVLAWLLWPAAPLSSLPPAPAPAPAPAPESVRRAPMSPEVTAPEAATAPASQPSRLQQPVQDLEHALDTLDHRVSCPIDLPVPDAQGHAVVGGDPDAPPGMLAPGATASLAYVDQGVAWMGVPTEAGEGRLQLDGFPTVSFRWTEATAGEVGRCEPETIAMPPLAHVAGVVRDEAGAPTRAVVDGCGNTVQAGPDGRWEMWAPATGRCEVSVTRPVGGRILRGTPFVVDGSPGAEIAADLTSPGPPADGAPQQVRPGP